MYIELPVRHLVRLSKLHEFSTQSIAASRKLFSNNFFESMKPCFVLPKEFGPDEVGVSRPILRMRILHSGGISSTSSSLSLLNALATVIFLVCSDGGLGWASFMWMPGWNTEKKFKLNKRQTHGKLFNRIWITLTTVPGFPNWIPDSLDDAGGLGWSWIPTAVFLSPELSVRCDETTVDVSPWPPFVVSLLDLSWTQNWIMAFS